MKYGVVVKVSRRSVTFWYQAEGKRFSPLAIRGSNEVPLYFCVENNQILFGQAARDRFYAHDPQSFGDYFEIIKDPSKHFVLHNNPRRVKQLLYYGIEQYLSYFLTSVVYESDSIESHRRTLPLKFIFEPGLDEPERRLVESLFTEAGYRTVSVASSSDLLLESLKTARLIGSEHAVLLLSGIDDTLYVEFYEKHCLMPASSLALPGQGADPRVRILAGMIMDYILIQNPHLDLDAAREASALLHYCTGLLSSTGAIITGDAELTNGDKLWFRVNLKEIDHRLQYYPGDLSVTAAISGIVEKFKIGSEQLMVVLGSGQIRTSYFTSRLLKQYPYVISAEPAHTDNAIQLFFNKHSHTTADERAVPPPRPSPPPPLPPPNGRTVQGTKPPLPQIKPAGERPKSVPPPPLPPTKK